MKVLKLSIFALTLGFFVTSCGNSETTEAPAADATTEATATPETTTPTEAITPVDSPVAPVDSPAVAQ